MTANQEQDVTEAFNSMLRTDYIALSDVEKLELLSFYYVDSLGYLDQVLGQSDQLIVGRRGTGKTTLLYRAFVECMASWKKDLTGPLSPRTLGIYIDLSKCSSVHDSRNFGAFEHAFVSELCDAIAEQLTRFWPELENETGLFDRLFDRRALRQKTETNTALRRLTELLAHGVPRLVTEREKRIETFSSDRTKNVSSLAGSAAAMPACEAKMEEAQEIETSERLSVDQEVEYRTTIADVLRTLSALMGTAKLPAIFLFIDEFSSLSKDLQGRFSTLLRKILGSHAGIFTKLSAITDNYTLGSSIILQRDLFEVSLDLDAYVERNHGLSQAMAGLQEHAQSLLERRLAAYGCPTISEIFEAPEEACELLSRAGMGVPRTIGIVLQQAWNNSKRHDHKIKRTDIEFGIRYASKAYLNQMLGASKGSVAIPSHVADMWYALLERATQERSKERRAASHFLVLPRLEEALRYLNMFFLIHLLTTARTTKKDSTNRSLYCFDYGVCLENNFDYTTDKNVIRQQRFAYDDVIEPFMKFYSRDSETRYRCSACGAVYKESGLMINGSRLRFCPTDRADLEPLNTVADSGIYTEEEIKIIGAIRSAAKGDKVMARRIADDVGCYVQKVAKFGEKLDKQDVIDRERDEDADKYIYFAPGCD